MFATHRFKHLQVFLKTIYTKDVDDLALCEQCNFLAPVDLIEIGSRTHKNVGVRGTVIVCFGQSSVNEF